MNKVFYDREKAVHYAEMWWNQHNPDFPVFSVDCTNYISQCLFAGGAPMWGDPDRLKGWWCQPNNWSLSWSVAHSFYWHLKAATNRIGAVEVGSVKELDIGDVICYDFQGNSRYDHTTIVVAKNNNHEPLVNAHTDNSRHRYWVYDDSAAWTPQINYAFFHIP